MARPEDPASSSPARASTRQRHPKPSGQKRPAKAAPARATGPIDSDFGVAMLVCGNDETPNDP